MYSVVPLNWLSFFNYHLPAIPRPWIEARRLARRSRDLLITFLAVVLAELSLRFQVADVRFDLAVNQRNNRFKQSLSTKIVVE
jgi:hypothetical protein